MKILKQFILLVIMACIFHACADLKAINDSSGVSVNALKTYDDIGYTFTSGYLKYQVPNQLQKVDTSEYRTGRIMVKPQGPNIGMVTISVKPEKAIKFFLEPLSEYFMGLNKLSNKDISIYNFDDIAVALKGDPALKSSLQINDDEINAAAKIAKTVAEDFTGLYAENKLRGIILKHDEHIGKTLDGLNACMEVLATDIDNSKSIVRGWYEKALLTSNISIDYKMHLLRKRDSILQVLYSSKLSMENKLLLLRECDNISQEIFSPKISMDYKLHLLQECDGILQELDKKKEAIDKYRKVILTIKDSHHKLALELKNNKLTSKQTITHIRQYGADVYEIWQVINALNKK